MSSWCVVSTRPHQEARAEANLVRQGYHAWLPTMLRSRRHARRIDTIRVPIFPGYLFVNLDLDHDAWSPINGTFGVRYLLTNRLRPQVLPGAFVATLQSSISEDGTCSPAPPDLKPGDTARIVTGPFVGCVAQIARLAPGDRVKLLLDVLGGAVSVTVPRKAIVAAA